MKGTISTTLALLFAGVTLFGCATQPPPSTEAAWTTLFDGSSNLNGWTRVGDANWRLQDGLLQADLLYGKELGYLVTKKVYADFQIRAEFWVDAGTNSGVFIRCEDPKDVGAKTCYEVNIWDTRPDPSYGTGAIVDVAKVAPMPKAGGQWNTYDITARGSQLTVVLNGVTTANVQDSKHARGHIALQFGSGIVKFRRVQIREL
jgi:hypothetical protein